MSGDRLPAPDPGAPRSTRRAFVKRAAAASLAVAAGAPALASPRVAGAAAAPFAGLPTFDGELVVDSATRRAMAADYGRHVYRLPLAVLRPRSVADVVRVVTYASRQGLKVGMRGQGHCVSGQAQVEDGIVIDSSSLNEVRVLPDYTADVQPGALWGEVARLALAQGLTPPVMPDALMLSAGGTLSVGGTGETSYRLGAQVDHVVELEVVLGSGQLATCSLERNVELFRMVLAGLGQVAIIVRARVRLVHAPRYVGVHTLVYDDLARFVADLARLASVPALGLGELGGAITRERDGRWRLEVLGGVYWTQPDERPGRAAWLRGFGFTSESGPAAVTYWNHLDRRTASVTSSKAGGAASPSLAVNVPEAATTGFLAHVLASPEAALGISRIEVLPMVAARFTAPLHKVPASPLFFALRLQRRVPAAASAQHEAMLAANRALVARARAAGGKIYPPFAPALSREEWQDHYGAETWERLANAKQRFDPGHVLTPGPGIF